MTPAQIKPRYEADADPGYRDGEIHLWFSLSYANYLVLRRSLLQSMPLEWQERFVGCLRELADAFYYLDAPDRFAVKVRGSDGRYESDPIPHYDRGRTRIKRRAARIEAQTGVEFRGGNEAA